MMMFTGVPLVGRRISRVRSSKEEKGKGNISKEG